jgi:hypothetical protein
MTERYLINIDDLIHALDNVDEPSISRQARRFAAPSCTDISASRKNDQSLLVDARKPNPTTAGVSILRLRGPFVSRQRPRRLAALGSARSPDPNERAFVAHAAQIAARNANVGQPLRDFTAVTITGFVGQAVKRGATVISDGLASYRSLKDHNHQAKVVSPMAAHVLPPWIHRVFSNFKRWALGTYHGVRRKHATISRRVRLSVEPAPPHACLVRHAAWSVDAAIARVVQRSRRADGLMIHRNTAAHRGHHREDPSR